MSREVSRAVSREVSGPRPGTVGPLPVLFTTKVVPVPSSTSTVPSSPSASGPSGSSSKVIVLVLVPHDSFQWAQDSAYGLVLVPRPIT